MLASQIKIRTEKFGSVIFDLPREKVFVTDEIGSAVLDGLRQGKSIDEIVNDFAEQYDCPRAVIKRDVNSFLKALRKAGLLVEGSGDRKR